MRKTRKNRQVGTLSGSQGNKISLQKISPVILGSDENYGWKYSKPPVPEVSARNFKMNTEKLTARLKEISLKKLIYFHLIAWTGTLVHLAVLWLAHGVLKVPLLIAGALAVEVAIIHNFTGHYFITWKDRISRSPRNYFQLLLRYNLVTASIDLVVNLGILWLLTHFLGVHYLIASITGQLLGPLFKLLANEFLVFPKLTHKQSSSVNEKEIGEKA